jgi:hypothetical protein
VHATFLFHDIVKNPECAHPRFPNRRLVFKGRRKIEEALPSPRRHARLVPELVTNFGENPSLVERTKRLEFPDRKFVDNNLVPH